MVQRNVSGVRLRDVAGHMVRCVALLGVRVDAVRLGELLRIVADAVRSRTPLTLFYVNAHTMNMASKKSDFRDLLGRADLVYCDGTGVRLGARILGEDLPERMTGADWIHDLCRTAVRERLSLYFLGSESGVADRAAALLRVRYPGLTIVGTSPGYGLSNATIDRVNQSGADILLVGMGSPTQERWIADNRPALDPPVVWAVGALFAFASGRLPRGPRWMTEHGLEWLCRLAVEPGKLWRRYLIGNPMFVVRVIRARVVRRTG